VEQSGSAAQVKPGAPVSDNQLAKSLPETLATPTAKALQGGNPGDEPSSGTGPNLGTAPIILIGPIVLCHPHPTEDDKGTTK
jgi:hypothetical protein